MILPLTDAPKNILSIDPGGTTGVAMRLHDPLLMPDRTYHTCTTSTPQELATIILDPVWHVVVMERFAAMTISKYGLYTVRLCGWVEALCWSRSIPLVYQAPQQRRAFQQQAQEYVRALGKGHVIHETEALAHLLAYEHEQAHAPDVVLTPELDHALDSPG